MDYKKLIATLKDLKGTRRLSSESEEMIKPFLGFQDEVTFCFVEANSTFGNRHGDQFKGGKTVLAHFAGTDLACSILYPPSENEWVGNLSKNEEFKAVVIVNELDNLYQRVVFATTILAAPVEESLVEETYPLEQPVTENSEDRIIPPISDLAKEDAAAGEDLNTSEDIELPSEETESDDKNAPEGLDQTKHTQEFGDTEFMVEESYVGNEEQVRSTPPPLPEAIEQKKPATIDHHYLAELRNKRYDFGESSLTEEEKEILAEDIQKNAASRQKDLEKNKENVNKGACAFFGFILILFSLNSCSKSGGFMTLVIFFIGLFLLFPFLKKIKEIYE